MTLRNATISALSAALVLSACSEKEPPTPAERKAAASVPGAPPGGAEDIAARDAPASDVRITNDLIEFRYAYPAEAARIAKLAAWLDDDRETVRETVVAAADRDKSAAEKQGFPYRRHSHLQTWQRVADTPRFLSLSAEIGTYGGGAHGMTAFDTLVWDRGRAMRLKPLDLFVGSEAFDAAVRDDFCAAITKAKQARGIEAPASDADASPFVRCPPASAQTLWLGSSDGRYFDRMTIAIAPYEIGPFAEGSYKINLPVTAAVARAVKPEYARDVLPIN